MQMRARRKCSSNYKQMQVYRVATTSAWELVTRGVGVDVTATALLQPPRATALACRAEPRYLLRKQPSVDLLTLGGKARLRSCFV